MSFRLLLMHFKCDRKITPYYLKYVTDSSKCVP